MAVSISISFTGKTQYHKQIPLASPLRQSCSRTYVTDTGENKCTIILGLIAFTVSLPHSIAQLLIQHGDRVSETLSANVHPRAAVWHLLPITYYIHEVDKVKQFATNAHIL